MPTDPTAPTRDLRLDLFRGLALVFIFINHIPGNAVSWLTNRYWGFSDATEIFVFLAGMSALLAYGRAMRTDGFAATLPRIWRRAWEVYAAHIFLVVALVAAVAVVTVRFGQPTFAEEMHVDTFFARTETAVVNALLLAYRPVNTDVLPLYVVLLLALPGALWALLRWPVATLAASALLWQVATQAGLNLARYPGGEWVFNPFAWQFVFMLGAFLALRPDVVAALLGRRTVLAPLAVGLVAFAAPIVIGWSAPSLAVTPPAWLAALLYPIDKTYADAVRILHFLALAYLAALVLPRGHRLLETGLARALILCGQHSLPVFCAGTLFSFLAYVAMIELDGGLASQIAVSLAGAAGLWAVAAVARFFDDRRGRRAGAGAGTAMAAATR